MGLFLIDFTGRETPGDQVRWVEPSPQSCQGNPKGWLSPIIPHSDQVYQSPPARRKGSKIASGTG